MINIIKSNLKKNIIFFLILSFAITSCSAVVIGGEVFKFDPLHSSATWEVNHFGFSNLTGKFTDIEGTVVIDKENMVNSSVEATINIKSLNTGLKKFDEHLLSSDFFDAEKYPTAKFVSNKIKILKNNQAKIYGTLTIRGVKRNEVMDVKLNKTGENPLTKKPTIGFTANLKIKRSSFGINYGIPNVGDDVNIEIQSELFSDGIEGKQISEQKEIKSEWKIISAKSKIEFIAKQNDSEVKGQFKDFIGNINFDPKDLKNAKAEIKIDITSLDMPYSEALEALKTATWLATKTYPQSIFRVEKFTVLPGVKTYQAKGILSLKGKNLPVDLDFKFKTLTKDQAHMIGQTKIKRSDFDVGNKDPKKSNGVEDEVQINVEIYAEK